jgi:hypothetical protein
MPYEEEDTCVSYEEEDTCHMRRRIHVMLHQVKVSTQGTFEK